MPDLYSPEFPSPILPAVVAEMRKFFEGAHLRRINPSDFEHARQVIAARFDSLEDFRAFRSFSAAISHARCPRAQALRRASKPKKRFCISCKQELHPAKNVKRYTANGMVSVKRFSVARMCENCIRGA